MAFGEHFAPYEQTDVKGTDQNSRPRDSPDEGTFRLVTGFLVSAAILRRKALVELNAAPAFTSAYNQKAGA
jgi:hypothetical protein